MTAWNRLRASDPCERLPSSVRGLPLDHPAGLHDERNLFGLPDVLQGITRHGHEVGDLPLLQSADLVGEMRVSVPTSEQYSVFRAYLDRCLARPAMQRALAIDAAGV